MVTLFTPRGFVTAGSFDSRQLDAAFALGLSPVLLYGFRDTNIDRSLVDYLNQKADQAAFQIHANAGKNILQGSGFRQVQENLERLATLNEHLQQHIGVVTVKVGTIQDYGECNRERYDKEEAERLRSSIDKETFAEAMAQARNCLRELETLAREGNMTLAIENDQAVYFRSVPAAEIRRQDKRDTRWMDDLYLEGYAQRSGFIQPQPLGTGQETLSYLTKDSSISLAVDPEHLFLNQCYADQFPLDGVALTEDEASFVAQFGVLIRPGEPNRYTPFDHHIALENLQMPIASADITGYGHVAFEDERITKIGTHMPIIFDEETMRQLKQEGRIPEIIQNGYVYDFETRNALGRAAKQNLERTLRILTAKGCEDFVLEPHFGYSDDALFGSTWLRYMRASQACVQYLLDTLTA